eukprot:g10897.t1
MKRVLIFDLQDGQAAKQSQTAEAIHQLRKKKEILQRYCMHSEKYRCDSKFLDMFGYNVGKHWNSILKCIA